MGYQGTRPFTYRHGRQLFGKIRDLLFRNAFLRDRIDQQQRPDGTAFRRERLFFSEYPRPNLRVKGASVRARKFFKQSVANLVGRIRHGVEKRLLLL